MKPSIKSKLWHHQLSAISFCESYINSKVLNGGSALVHVPTGAGKSGIITVVTAHSFQKKTCLILTPRKALTKQIYAEVKERFFAKMKIKETPLKEVIHIKEGESIKEKVDPKVPAVYVMTIQKLLADKKKLAKSFSDFVKLVDYLVIDEGHCEPAETWSELIRTFKCPRMVFTATPFRNDFKVFDIDSRFIFNFTYREAVEAKLIRDVKFVKILSPSENPDKFVKSLLAEYKKIFSLKELVDKKVIIRCESAEKIKQISNALKNEGRSVIGIHDTFDTDSKLGIYKDVPDPKTIAAQFWVHQFKLIEGIDSSEFRVLAAFDKLNSTRALVQQIGRVIRTSDQKVKQTAYVFDYFEGLQEKRWQEFDQFDKRIFDSKFSKKKDKESVSSIIEGSYASIEIKSPKTAYIIDRFREKFDPHARVKNVMSELLVPLRANVFKKNTGITEKDILNEIEVGLKKENYIKQKYDVDDNTRVVTFVRLSPTPLLEDKYYIDTKFGIVLIKIINDTVFYLSTAGGVGPSEKFLDMTQLVSKDSLEKIYSKKQLKKITSVNLLNSQNSLNQVRSKSITADAINNTTPYFDDQMFICSAAEGVVEAFIQTPRRKTSKRSIGFNSGKVSETNSHVTVYTYFKWLNFVEGLINSRPGTGGISLNRYAEMVKVPSRHNARFFTLIFNANEDLSLIDKENKMQSTDFDFSDAKVDKMGKFAIKKDGKFFNGTINFDVSHTKYLIKSTELDTRFQIVNEDIRESFCSYFNKTQEIRVLPEEIGITYYLGSFHNPGFKFGPNKSEQISHVLDSLTESKQLTKVKSEKGKTIVKGTWEKDSLFHLIVNWARATDLKATFGEYDVKTLVCDDMGKECCDFLAKCERTSRANSIIFIHGKASKDAKPDSASALQEVLGQATKNLKYASRYNFEGPPKHLTWGTDNWSAKPHVAGVVSDRVIVGRKKYSITDTGKDIWRDFASIKANPQNETEVWIMLGNITSKKSLKLALTTANGLTSEAEQSFYLIYNFLSTANALGIKVKIFCMP